MEGTFASDEERLRAGFVTALGRPPTARESGTLLGLLEEARGYYAKNAEAAEELAGGHMREGMAPVEMAAWVATTRIVLNLDEFITRG